MELSNTKRTQTFQQLEKSGVDPIELSKNINVVAFLSDIIEGRARKIEEILKSSGNYQFADKIYIQNIAHYSGFMQKSTSKTLGLKFAESFGDTCDFINEVVELAGSAETEEQKIKILSTLKTIIK